MADRKERRKEGWEHWEGDRRSTFRFPSGRRVEDKIRDGVSDFVGKAAKKADTPNKYKIVRVDLAQNKTSPAAKVTKRKVYNSLKEAHKVARSLTDRVSKLHVSSLFPNLPPVMYMVKKAGRLAKKVGKKGGTLGLTAAIVNATTKAQEAYAKEKE